METALKIWRTGQGLTLKDVAVKLGIAGKNPAATYLRLETGQHRFSPVMAEAVVELTGGAVTVQDLHDANLKFDLKHRRPAPAG